MLKLYVKSLNLLHSLKDECGQDSIEYAILIGIIAVAIVGNVTTIASFVSGKFSNLAATL